MKIPNNFFNFSVVFAGMVIDSAQLQWGQCSAAFPQHDAASSRTLLGQGLPYHPVDLPAIVPYLRKGSEEIDFGKKWTRGTGSEEFCSEGF